jgi:hypothetical protein
MPRAITFFGSRFFRGSAAAVIGSDSTGLPVAKEISRNAAYLKCNIRANLEAGANLGLCALVYWGSHFHPKVLESFSR